MTTTEFACATTTTGGAAGAGQTAGSAVVAPNLPVGGGAIRGIDESFTANPATGSASFSVTLPISAGRSGLTPDLSLSYDSGSGNGPFGLGWSLNLQTLAAAARPAPPSLRRRDARRLRVVGAGRPGARSRSGQHGSLAAHHRRPRRVRRRHVPAACRGLLRAGRTLGTPRRRRHVLAHDQRRQRDDRVRSHAREPDPDPPTASRVFTWLACARYDGARQRDGLRLRWPRTPPTSTTAPRTSATAPTRPTRRQPLPRAVRYGNRVPNRDESGAAFDPATPRRLDVQPGPRLRRPRRPRGTDVDGPQFVSVTDAARRPGTWPARRTRSPPTGPGSRSARSACAAAC